MLSRVRLFVTPCTIAYQAPLSMGFFSIRVLKWGAISSSRVSLQPRDPPASIKSPVLASWFLTISTTWEAQSFILLSSAAIYIFMLFTYELHLMQLNIPSLLKFSPYLNSMIFLSPTFSPNYLDAPFLSLCWLFPVTQPSKF